MAGQVVIINKLSGWRAAPVSCKLNNVKQTKHQIRIFLYLSFRWKHKELKSFSLMLEIAINNDLSIREIG